MLNHLLEVMQEVLQLPAIDGVQFDLESLSGEAIKMDTIYPGTRIFCQAYLGKAHRRLHFDIGFGDEIVPNPVKLDFPVILDDMPSPILMAYTPESAIAEKYQTIIHLGLINSRMKDFYDIFYLANYNDFQAAKLSKAIKTTCKNRNTNLSCRFEIYRVNFINDENKQKQWSAFIRRQDLKIDLSFPEVIKYIKKFIEPILSAQYVSKWNAETQRWI